MAPHVRHAGEADGQLEVAGDELGPVVGEHPGLDAGVELTGTLDELLHAGLLHPFADMYPLTRPHSAVTVAVA